jgi:hypothetical protein
MIYLPIYNELLKHIVKDESNNDDLVFNNLQTKSVRFIVNVID